jgi:hypothetical protein
MPYEQSAATMAQNLETLFETFCHDLGLEHQFSSLYTPP